MKKIKKIFGNIPNLVIAVLIILLLLKTCNKSFQKPTTITTTTTITKWDTIKTSIPIYVPKYNTKITYLPDTDTLWREIDTAFILKDYMATYSYSDTIKNDSITITIQDSINRNKIKNRKVDYSFIFPTITITITKDNVIVTNNRELYVGAGIGVSLKQVNHISGDLIFRTKKRMIYGLGIGITNNFQPLIKGGIFWKLGK
jgi:hypothetical protein